jgi:hypothetical protein
MARSALEGHSAHVDTAIHQHSIPDMESNLRVSQPTKSHVV